MVVVTDDGTDTFTPGENVPPLEQQQLAGTYIAGTEIICPGSRDVETPFSVTHTSFLGGAGGAGFSTSSVLTPFPGPATAF